MRRVRAPTVPPQRGGVPSEHRLSERSESAPRRRRKVTSRRDPLAGLAAVGAGLLVALSLPPWGWWPLAPIGIAVFDRLVADRPRRSRFTRGWLFGIGWLPLGMGWMW